MVDQTSQFYAILTNVGAAKQANADALGIAWKITQMGVGDANGSDPTPNATQTSLINEWRRAPLNQLKVDDKNSAIIIAEQVIPADVGGKWIREIALYDADGDMVAVANCAPTYKPLLSQGSGRTQVVRMNLVVSSASNVQLKIDPAVVLATREWVTEELARQDFKHSVLAATTANIALTGLQTVDGVVLAAGARVLVKNQTTAKDNGLYLVVSGGAWTRCTDADTSEKVTPGMLVLVERGTVNGDSAWQLVTDATISLGVSALAYQMAFGRTGVATGTYRSVSVDVYGRVSAATNPTTVAGYGLTDVYTKTELDQALALKAPLASPALTGSPTAPTPLAGNNSTQLANTAFVQAAISKLIASAPGALDTLNELAAALGNDPNFATTMTNALALKAPLASPALSGTPTAPTKSRFDASAGLATTEFVQRALGSLSGNFTIMANTQLTAEHVGARIEVVNSITVTLPDVGSVPVGSQILLTTAVANSALTVKTGNVLALNNISVPTPYAMGASSDVLLINDGFTWRGHLGAECLKNSPMFAASLSVNGYQKLPGGYIRQWGSAAIPANGSLDITLPTTFPTQAFGVICQYTNGLGGVAGRCGGGAISPSTIRLESAVPGITGLQNVWWIANGK
jgi:phage-related tail fiber protein